MPRSPYSLRISSHGRAEGAGQQRQGGAAVGPVQRDGDGRFRRPVRRAAHGANIPGNAAPLRTGPIMMQCKISALPAELGNAVLAQAVNGRSRKRSDSEARRQASGAGGAADQRPRPPCRAAASGPPGPGRGGLRQGPAGGDQRAAFNSTPPAAQVPSARPCRSRPCIRHAISLARHQPGQGRCRGGPQSAGWPPLSGRWPGRGREPPARPAAAPGRPAAAHRHRAPAPRARRRSRIARAGPNRTGRRAAPSRGPPRRPSPRSQGRRSPDDGDRGRDEISGDGACLTPIAPDHGAATPNIAYELNRLSGPAPRRRRRGR